MTTTINNTNALAELANTSIEVNAPEPKEYRLMYFWGAWVTKYIIYAESDAEAIFDADVKMLEGHNHCFSYALFGSKGMVKRY